MSEENQEWQAPPPPEEMQVPAEPPKMSALQTLIDIFYSPGDTFEDISKKPFPRLVLPLVLCVILISGWSFALTQKIGPERVMKEQLQSKWMAQITDEAKSKMLEDAKNTSPVRTAINSLIGGIIILVVFTIMGLIYWAAGLVFGGSGSFWNGLAVVSYSSFPPLLISMVASFIILFLKDADDISFFQSQSGLLKTNPGLFLNISPAVNAIFTRIDLLVIWGMILAVIGLQKCLKISSGSAWTISIIFWLIGTTLAIVGGLFAG